MDKEDYNRLKKFLPRMCDEVDPEQLFPYLNCLTTADKQKIKCDINNDGSWKAVLTLVDTLRRRKGAYEQFLYGLMQQKYEDLVRQIDPEGYEAMKGPDENTTQHTNGTPATSRQRPTVSANINVGSSTNVTVQIGEHNQMMNKPGEIDQDEILVIERRGDDDDSQDLESFGACSMQGGNIIQDEECTEINSLHEASGHTRKKFSYVDLEGPNTKPDDKRKDQIYGKKKKGSDVTESCEEVDKEGILTSPVEETGQLPIPVEETCKLVTPVEEMGDHYQAITSRKQLTEIHKHSPMLSRHSKDVIQKEDVRNTIQAKSVETSSEVGSDNPPEDETLLKSGPDDTLLKTLSSVNLNPTQTSHYGRGARHPDDPDSRLHAKNNSATDMGGIAEHPMQNETYDSITEVKKQHPKPALYSNPLDGQTLPRVKIIQNETSNHLKQTISEIEISLHVDPLVEDNSPDKIESTRKESPPTPNHTNKPSDQEGPKLNGNKSLKAERYGAFKSFCTGIEDDQEKKSNHSRSESDEESVRVSDDSSDESDTETGYSKSGKSNQKHAQLDQNKRSNGMSGDKSLSNENQDNANGDTVRYSDTSPLGDSKKSNMMNDTEMDQQNSARMNENANTDFVKQPNTSSLASDATNPNIMNDTEASPREQLNEVIGESLNTPHVDANTDFVKQPDTSSLASDAANPDIMHDTEASPREQLNEGIGESLNTPHVDVNTDSLKQPDTSSLASDAANPDIMNDTEASPREQLNEGIGESLNTPHVGANTDFVKQPDTSSLTSDAAIPDIMNDTEASPREQLNEVIGESLNTPHVDANTDFVKQPDTSSLTSDAANPDIMNDTEASPREQLNEGIGESLNTLHVNVSDDSPLEPRSTTEGILSANRQVVSHVSAATVRTPAKIISSTDVPQQEDFAGVQHGNGSQKMNSQDKFPSASNVHETETKKSDKCPEEERSRIISIEHICIAVVFLIIGFSMHYFIRK